MLKYILTGLLIWSSQVCLFSQIDSLEAEKWVVQAKNCLKNGAKDSAAIYSQKALKAFRRMDLLAPWLKTHTTLAFTWAYDLNQPFTGLDLITGSIHQVWRQPKSAREWSQWSLSHLNAGHFLKDFACDFEGTKIWYEKGLDIFIQRLGEHDDRIAKYVYHQLGNLYTRLGDYERAVNLLKRGIDYAQKYNLPQIADHSDLALALKDMGKLSEALVVTREGLAFPGVGTEKQIGLQLNMAEIYMQLVDYAHAKTAIQTIPALIKTLEREEKSNVVNVSYWQMAYQEINGLLCQNLKQYPQSLQHYSKACDWAVKKWGTENRREIAKLHNKMATVWLDANQPAKALGECQKALTCLLPKFNPSNSAENPHPNDFFPENTFIDVLETKALALEKSGKLEQSLVCYELIPKAESVLRSKYAYESSALLSLDAARARFEKGIGLAWQLYQQHPNQSMAERAFRLTEQARGLLLMKSLARAKADFRMQLPEEVRQHENNLLSKIAWHELQIAQLEAENGAANEKKQFENALFDLKQEQVTFTEKLRADYPDYARLSDELHFVEANDVRTLLRPQQAMVNFFLTATEGYVFCLDGSGLVSWRKIVLPDHFREDVGLFTQYFNQYSDRESDKQRICEMATTLYRLLIEPELSTPRQYSRLTIVPDDILAFLPFELLLQPTQNNHQTWATLPYLFRDYSIGYAFSATLLQMQQQISQNRNKGARLFGGFAPVYADVKNVSENTRKHSKPLVVQAGGATNLVGTHEELRQIQALVGGDSFDGAAADEACFKREASQYRILHLAMHALADEENPALSCLLFGNKTANSTEDNTLYINELQTMRLQADLAVLSACRTGFGKLHKGEGVYSLSRAFAAAGVPATIMSLWRLPDQTAPALMTAFYANLQKGMTKDEALRQAKIDFLAADQNFDLSHPFFWASLMANGDMQNLDMTDDSLPFGLPIFGGLLLLGMFYYLRKPKPSIGKIE